jgi:hypothetical protein
LHFLAIWGKFYISEAGLPSVAGFTLLLQVLHCISCFYISMAGFTFDRQYLRINGMFYYQLISGRFYVSMACFTIRDRFYIYIWQVLPSVAVKVDFQFPTGSKEKFNN